MTAEANDSQHEITDEQLQLALDAGHELAKIEMLLGKMPEIHPGEHIVVSNEENHPFSYLTEPHGETALYGALQARKAQLLEMLRDMG